MMNCETRKLMGQLILHPISDSFKYESINHVCLWLLEEPFLLNIKFLV